ncbi:hypothetical protein CW304_28025 [Bacillus sp. UFRGS-B20]|nr:hypothetical protein CW304_28025 [Bacillus sp. UFRGS-B20]
MLLYLFYGLTNNTKICLGIPSYKKKLCQRIMVVTTFNTVTTLYLSFFLNRTFLKIFNSSYADTRLRNIRLCAPL